MPPVGYPDQLSKLTFAAETPVVTDNAVLWEDPPEIPTADLRPDGYLRVVRPNALGHLPWPWPGASSTDEVLLETKMAGDHSDAIQFERALLRRQARQVQRASKAGPTNVLELNDSALWFLAPNLPKWLEKKRKLVMVGPGCYSVEPTPFPLLWIAANELPLHDALVAFLVARSGRPLLDFIRWVFDRRPLTWLTDVVKFLPMSVEVRDVFLEHLAERTDDPEIEERQNYIVRFLLDRRPEVKRDVKLEALAPIMRQIERRLGRPLTAAERSVLLARLDAHGAQLGDLVLDLPTDKLVEWLASSADH